MIQKILLTVLLLSAMSCKKDVREDKDVYQNNFDTADNTGIQNFLSGKFNDGGILGPYSGSNFVLTLNGLPKHKLLKISFDLYIHNSWMGNDGPDGVPDLWQMTVDGKTYISTTFSNVVCAAGNFCAPQAYPEAYPNNNHNPRSGAVRLDLPGLCQSNQISTQYHIEKTITHSATDAQMQCLGKLVRSSLTSLACNPSWSVDNLKVTAIDL